MNPDAGAGNALIWLFASSAQYSNIGVNKDIFMLRNHFTIAVRNLFKNRIFSFLNIAGLAIGMAAFLFIIHYVRFERSYEDFNPKADNIYRITLDLYNGSEYVVTDCEMYPSVGPMLKDKMPEVLDYVRMMHNDGLQDTEANNKKFLEEQIYFADPSALDFFSVALLKGEKNTALSSPMQIVIAESIAEKYFGSTEVLGEPIKIKGREYHVSGVMKDLPQNTHLKFRMLISHASVSKIYNWYKDDSFNGNNEYTYLLMAPGTDLESFQAKLTAFAISLKDKIGNELFGAEPIKDIHLHSTKSFEPEPTGSARVVNFMLVIAVFIIAIAWVNYVNLSTARAVDRAREVGIRKVMGSLRLQLILQFLSESVMVNVLAAFVAFIFFQTALPVFQSITGLPLPLDFYSDPVFWILFSVLTLAGSLLSGLYPAFVLSSFQPASVLKGKFRYSAHGHGLRKGLVTFQFAAAVVLMVGISAVYLQIKHLRNQDLGMNLDQTLVIRAPHIEEPDSLLRVKYQSLKTELLRQPQVQGVAASEGLPGLSLHEISTTSNIKRVGHENVGGSYNYYFSSIDANLIPTLNMTLVAGNNFQDGGRPNNGQVIINEEAVARLGFANAGEAVGSKITFKSNSGEPSTVIGVVGNFYHQSPKEQQIPMLFYYDDLCEYYSVKLETENMAEAVTSVKAVWHKVFPNAMFHHFFLDEQYDQQFRSDKTFGFVTATFSFLAVFIACLGLFGLSAFTIVQRTKEIGIRKVLGASVPQIVHLLSIGFVKVVLIAAVLGLPVAYLAVDQWLSAYAVRINLTVWIFLIPVVVILLIAILTITWQTLRTALLNPAHYLNQE